MDLIRGLSATQKGALRASIFYPNLMVFVDWPGDPLRFNMRETDMVYQGETYYGFGPLANLALPGESQGIAADVASLSIAGVDHDLNGKMNSPVRGREVAVYMALMSSRVNGARIGDPIPLFKGTIGSMRMRTTAVSDTDLMSTIEVDLSTGPSARAKSSIYHTDEDQRSKYPADTAGRLVILSYAKAQKLRWPE